MKKVILMLGVIATAFTLVSCSTCCPPPCAKPAPCPCACAHHDYKGEVGK